MLTIGSRGSQLALWQAHWIQSRIQSFGIETRLEIIHTTGDKITDVALSKVGTKGLFTKEIEEALLNHTIDLAVHSLKDMPTDLPDGLTLAAIPEREDPRDALIGKSLASLGQSARVGTSSLRRAAQLRALRPDLQIENIRGNLDTRLRKLDEGQYDAIVLASAGLRRLGWENRITELLDPEIMCPAVGQGALAVETREDNGEAHQLAKRLEHEASRIAVTAERAVLASLGGGCQVPIGAYATVGAELHLRAIIVSPDGTQIIRKQASGEAASAAAMGRALGDQLLAAGGREILELVYGHQ
ncbi:MAG TPA: hydroxymethylbilane synthase [Bryobacteraceae bacterium]|nr:hydroxymethylbilane synthase [Bryobacteraceae bacterium]